MAHLNSLLPSFLFTILLIPLICQCAKENKSSSSFKFRMEKLNFVWAKAEHYLRDDPARLRKLQSDLAEFDSIYLGLKQVDPHHKEKGPDSREVDRVDGKLERLLERYDLDEAIHAFRMKYKYDKSRMYSLAEGESDTEQDRASNSVKTGESGAEKAPFEDPRVAKLWEEAKDDVAFTLKELDDLYYELEQHERKLSDYRQLMEHVESLSANHVHHPSMDAEQEESIASMKEIGKLLDKDLARIEKRVTEIKRSPFKLSKVKRLWAKALKSPGLISNELDAIKSELKHFERHWEKVEHHQRHVNEIKEIEAELGGDGGSEWAAEAQRMQTKLESKLKKLEIYLDEKIAGSEGVKHTEL